MGFPQEAFSRSMVDNHFVNGIALERKRRKGEGIGAILGPLEKQLSVKKRTACKLKQTNPAREERENKETKRSKEERKKKRSSERRNKPIFVNLSLRPVFLKYGRNAMSTCLGIGDQKNPSPIAASTPPLLLP